MKTLRALHVIPSVSKKHGGPSYAIQSIAKALQQSGVDVVIVTTDDDGDGSRLDVPLGVPLERDGITHFFFRRNFLPYKISFGLRNWLSNNVANFDIVHIHALFSFSSTAAAQASRKHGVPYVVRPLGVLNQWGMQHRRRILKSISFKMIEARILRGAAAIHFTTEKERAEANLVAAKLGLLRSVVVPLPIETRNLGDGSNPEKFLARFPKARNRQIILFLSRVHPKKGIELLLEAFADLRRHYPSAVLVMAGEGSGDYMSILRQRIDEMNLADCVIWTGFLEGDEKEAAFDAAALFVLPSFSENFGIAVAEALAGGVPVIITEGVGLAEEIRTANAGIVVAPEAPALARGLSLLLEDAEGRRGMASRGRRLAKDRFSYESIGRALKVFYEEAINRNAQHLGK